MFLPDRSLDEMRLRWRNRYVESSTDIRDVKYAIDEQSCPLMTSEWNSSEKNDVMNRDINAVKCVEYEKSCPLLYDHPM